MKKHIGLSNLLLIKFALAGILGANVCLAGDDPASLAASETTAAELSQKAEKAHPSGVVAGPFSVNAPQKEAVGVSFDQGPDAEALKKRVAARWQAIIERKYEEAYLFCSPAYRKAFPISHFLGQYAEQVKRERVEVSGVKFQDKERDKAEVTFELYYLTDAWGLLYHGSSSNREAWVKVDGEWYLSPKK